MSTHTDTIPWYKQPLVWMVIVIPGFAVVGGLSLLAVSIYIDDGVIVDDYYKRGKEINRVLVRDKKAVELGLRGMSIYSPEQSRLDITLASSTGAALPQTVQINLYHGTRGQMDVSLLLQQQGNTGHYQATLTTQLASGPWNVQLGTDDWRIHGRLHMPNVKTAVLQPEF